MLLIGAYAAGQGGIFAVQTVLLAEDRLLLLAGFGTAFSFAILGSVVIDFGGLTVLARETAAAGRDAERIWATYWGITAWRALAGLATAVAMAVPAVLIADPLVGSYALWALPAALLWPFNASGILDGLRVAGISGLIGSIPYLCSAAALLAAMQMNPADAGALLGGALSLGYGLTLLCQYAALRRIGCTPRWVRPGAELTLALGREGGTVMFATLPGQLYFRYQVLLANLVMGPAGTAIFLYGKQVATAVAQAVGFVRRVEFPELVARLVGGGENAFATVLRTQRGGTVVAALGAAVMLAGGAAGVVWLPGSLGEAAGAVALFAPVVVAGAVAMALVQGLQAGRQYRVAAVTLTVAVVIGGGLNAAVLIWPALLVFVMADVAHYVVTAVLSWGALAGKREAA